MNSIQPKTKKVLIIEDDTAMAAAVKKRLQVKGFEVECFDTAEAAYTYLWSDAPLPFAIWLDFQLKGMNGLAFLLKINGQERLATIPIIVVTNSASKETTDAMLAVGAKKVFMKVNTKLEAIVDEIVGYWG